MAIVLGIHNGHHASCAVVRDGALVAGIEQERVTRRKGDGSQGLTNHLPVRECLRAAGASLLDVDLIVSSFQAIGPGGAGLTQPLVEPGFNLFDPFDARHLVISHHLGHALSALGTSGFRECAILVCDLAGSTTRDGKDFALPFADFVADVTTLGWRTETKTECLSVYHANEQRLKLRHREFCVPHSAPEVFVHSPASLYDNVARMVFRKENAHGELMALASVAAGSIASSVLAVDDILDFWPSGVVSFKNGWQYRVSRQTDELDYASLAAIVQEAFQRSVLGYVATALRVAGSTKLAAAGGVFLNIVANAAIESSGIFDHFFVPSSPHDAGVAIGCAYHGWRCIASRSGVRVTTAVGKPSDRLGIAYDEVELAHALRSRSHLVSSNGIVGPREIAELLWDGQIVARFAGRAEFGPRALGGRSLLATPLRAGSKDRLNLIKGRQPWRPVAPVVLHELVGDFFDGPQDSPYMNMMHRILDRHRDVLVALQHPDGSARVQTLAKCDDPFLYEMVREFGLLTGYPVVVNTSLNGPGEPIVETPTDAIDFFLSSDGVDLLLLGDHLVGRIVEPSWRGTWLASDSIVSTIRLGDRRRFILLRHGKSMEVSREALEIMEGLPEVNVCASDLNAAVRAELRMALFGQFLVLVQEPI